MFWGNLSIWRYVINCVYDRRLPTLSEAMIEKRSPLSDIDYINLKKKHEARATSDWNDLAGYVARDWDEFISRQIENIDPDVLFCCGTFGLISDRMDLSHIDGAAFLAGSRLVVDFRHPSTRFRSYESIYYELLGGLLRFFAQRDELGRTDYSRFLLQAKSNTQL